MGERGPDQATHIDLPDPLLAGPGEQGPLLDETQRVIDRGLMGPFDYSRDRWFGDRPQRRDRLYRGECRSYPATVCARGRELFAIWVANSAASIGARPCSATKNSRATSVRIRARSA